MDPAVKRFLWWGVGVLVSLIAFIVLFQKFDFADVAQHLRSVWALPLVLAFLYSIAANYILSGWQWRAVYFEMGHNQPILEHIFVKSALYPLRAVIPFRAGDLGRPLYLSRVHGIPFTKSLAASALVPGINLSILLFFSVIGFLVAGKIFGAFFCFLLLSAGAVAFAFARSFLQQNRGRSDGTWIGDRLAQVQWLAKFTWEKYLPLVLFGVATIFGQVMEFAMIASAFKVQIPFRIALGYIPIIILAGSIPISLMGLGIRETAAILILAPYATPDRLLSIALVFSFLDQIVLAVMGSASLVPFIYACRKDDWPTVKEK